MVKKEVSQTAEERIRSLDEIRQITRELIDIQMDGCSEEELSDKQRLLNVKYDAFVKQYGAITSIRAKKRQERVQRNIMAIPIKRRTKRRRPFDNQ